MGNITEFLIQAYFTQLYSKLGKKMYSNSLSLALSLAETNNKKKYFKRLQNIYYNTTDEMKIPLPVLENIIEKQYLFKKRIKSMQRQRINGRIIPNHKIVMALSNAYNEVTSIVTKIAKELNVNIDFDINRYPVDKE
jgi:DNA mismatch repair ATPase MutL